MARQLPNCVTFLVLPKRAEQIRAQGVTAAKTTFLQVKSGKEGFSGREQLEDCSSHEEGKTLNGKSRAETIG